MKATITELWQTGTQIITFDNDEFNSPSSIADLKKCENVLIGKYDKEIRATEILIDNNLVMVAFKKVEHPSGGGKLYVCEIMYC